MAKNEEPHIKSAYELAMERLDAAAGTQASLNNEQKVAMAGIEQDIKSQVAQAEIMMRNKVMRAQQGGDVAKAHEVEDEYRRDIEKIKEKGEARKKKIWDQAGA